MAQATTKLNERSSSEEVTKGRLANRGAQETTHRQQHKLTLDHDQSSCPECGGELSTDQEGMETERYCSRCGLVLDVADVDPGPEWRSFEDGPEPSRGGNTRDNMKHDYGLGSEISSGQSADFQFKRMRRWNRQEKMTSADQTLADAFTDIRTVVSQLGYSRSIAIRAGRIFRMAQERDIFGPGNVREIFAGAAVYAACRELQQPVIPGQITEVLTIEDSDTQGEKTTEDLLWRRYNKLCKELGIKQKPTTATDYIPFLISQLPDRLQDLTRLALEVAEIVMEATWSSGRNPRTIAGAVVSLVADSLCEFSLPTQDVSEAIDITPTSINRALTAIKEAHYEEIEKHLDGKSRGTF